MKKFVTLAVFVFICIFAVYFFDKVNIKNVLNKKVEDTKKQISNQAEKNIVNSVNNINPLSIEYARKQNYPGSEIVFEQTLGNGSNYKKYIISYKSDGYKIYALLTIPTLEKPKNGFPVIIFNHGYIPPKEYVTTEKYVAYQDAFARSGYITIKSDYRGHGKSEGEGFGGYGSPGYVNDVLNEVASIKGLVNPDTKEKITNSEKIGMWGHSMGGYITLRSMVISKDIKVGVIWAGVVASYPDMINNWRRPGITPDVAKSVMPTISSWRAQLIQQFGQPSEDSEFWKSISANFYLKDISGPIQLHHGTSDSSVPIEFTLKLKKELEDVGKTVEYYEYPGDDHNLSKNLSTALNRSVEFFDKVLK